MRILLGLLQRISVRDYTDPYAAHLGFREVLVGARVIRHHAVTLQSTPRPGDHAASVHFRVGFPASRWRQAGAGRDRQVNPNDFSTIAPTSDARIL